jgi:hypothetical protein
MGLREAVQVEAEVIQIFTGSLAHGEHPKPGLLRETRPQARRLK